MWRLSYRALRPGASHPLDQLRKIQIGIICLQKPLISAMLLEAVHTQLERGGSIDQENRLLVGFSGSPPEPALKGNLQRDCGL